jgi:phosphoglycerate dehydrogenase-like enzyme
VDEPLVILTEPLDDAAVQWLGEHARVERIERDAPGFAARLAQAAGLVVRTYTIVDAVLLSGAANLRVVGRAGAGLDNIDVAACRERGIEVVYRPEANTQAVVEYVVCLLCDALRPRTTLDGPLDAHTWHRLRADVVADRQMSELTLGILGLGRIGARVAAVASALGFRVLYNDLLPISPALRGDANPVSVDALFEESDVITLHVDGREANRGCVGSSLLSRLKANAVLVNTSRGFVVDNVELRSCLSARPDVRAFLDVHEPEPPAPEESLLAVENAVLLPHLASRTRTAMTEMSWVVRDVVAVLEGSEVAYPAP